VNADNTLCDIPDISLCETCVGQSSSVTDDSDGDGVCDANETSGCTDDTACNFDQRPTTDTDDTICEYPMGCDTCSGEQDGIGVIVDNDADDDGICDVDEIVGCQNEMACDYNESATDDGSCTYAEDGFDCEGNKFNACPNDLFVEYYSPALNYDENLCVTLIMLGCTDSTAYNFDSSANTDDLSCISKVYGCTDSTAYNYSEFVNTDDDSCIPVSEGCTNSDAQNYDVSANSDDGSCLIEGCMNATAENYNSDAGIDDGTCVIFGCTVQSACNFNMDATDDDQSCLIPSKCEICIGYLHYDSGTIKYDLKDDESGFCLNITETDAKGIYIYPNPTKSYFSISDVNYQEIEIYSLTGQLMVHIESYHEEINISHLSNGLYTLIVMGVDGNLSYGKLIKK
jgi:hypothetical protein